MVQIFFIIVAEVLDHPVPLDHRALPVPLDLQVILVQWQ
jgi:hypothetical protein